jgi:hypothetical protein
VLGIAAAGVIGGLLPVAAGARTARTSAATTTASPGGTTIWPSTAVPAVAADSDTAAVELGVRFKADVTGTVSALRYYKSTSNTGTHVGSLWTSGGTRLASVTFAGETPSGWQQANLTTPVTVNAGATYVASYYAPAGRYSADGGYFSSKGADNGVLHAPAGANGVYRYGASGFPTSTYQSTNYWVDVVFNSSSTPTTAAPAPTTTVAPATTTTTTAPATTTTTKAPAPTTTTTVAAPPPPPSATWPGSGNTGVPAGTPMTVVNGTLTVSTPGAVVEGKDVNGCVDVTASNVTLRKIRVRNCAREPMVNVGYGLSGVLIEDSELDGSNLNGLASSVGYEGYTIRRSNIHNIGKGLHMTNNVTIEDNWIHDLYETADSHNDDVVTNGGSNFVVRHNTLENSHTQTATVALYGDFAPVVNALIENNLLLGGGYTVYGGSVAGKPYTSGAQQIRFTNNVFGKKYWPQGGYWGPASAFDPSRPGNQWTGNVWQDTGAAVPSS